MPEQQLEPDIRDSLMRFESSMTAARSLPAAGSAHEPDSPFPRPAPAPPTVVRDSTASGTSILLLTATPSATTDARHWTAAQLRLRGFQSVDVQEDAELVVSELVSNAVLHGRAPITVTLVDAPGDLTVSVADAGGPPYLFGSRPADPTAAHGRGLSIVATLALSWGIQAQHPGPGKTVWGRLSTATSTTET